MKNRKTMLIATFVLAALVIAGQQVFAAQSDGPQGMGNMMSENGMNGMMQMMENKGMQKMMDAMDSPEGKQMMNSCSKFMESYEDQET
ncbi:hypothetical protein [Paenibacillus alkalitolerans]|uniref:hypothetical protein n=1 Tax=Paenibacillus alkalitolerans TaxID=2799335 RepID=UPI0018F4E145|nr:hypothetical protein [Paenibacillus alkalitolerans]